MSTLRLRSTAQAGLWLAAAALLTAATAAPAGPMDRQQLYAPPERAYEIHPRLEPLLSQALQQPGQLIRIQAMREVARLGLGGQAERVIELVDAESTAVATTALQTLNKLDARSAADRLVKLLRSGSVPSDQIRLADAMLSRWGENRAVELWRTRLAAEGTPLTLQRSAAEALGRTPGDDPQPSAELLRTVILNARRPRAVRLAAAEALGRIAGQRDTPLALDTAAEMGDGSFEALLAVRLLRSAEGERGIEQLRQRAAHGEPAVQFAAMRRLFELDPELLWPRAQKTLNSGDPRVRLVSVRSLESRRQEQTIGWLTESLNDPHPEVRTEARRMLHSLSGHDPLLKPVKAALRGVIDQAIEEKARDEPPHWRAAEQAALLLGTLEDKPVAGRLVELFDHSRPEVRIASVKTLRKLEVPSTREPMARLMDELSKELPELLERGRELEDPAKSTAVMDRWRAQTKLAAETAQTLGVWGVEEAEPALRKFIPKSYKASSRARASAIWALGLLHADEPREDLASPLVSRLFDLNPMNPEAKIVRQHAAEALGRMRAESKLENLRNAMGSEQQGLEVRSAVRWAVMRIADEQVPQLAAPTSREIGHFLSPYGDE